MNHFIAIIRFDGQIVFVFSINVLFNVIFKINWYSFPKITMHKLKNDLSPDIKLDLYHTIPAGAKSKTHSIMYVTSHKQTAGETVG